MKNLKIAIIYVICIFSSAGAYDVIQLTHGAGEAGHASWSPDGSMIAYNYGEYGSRDIWIIPSEGGEPTQITTHAANDDTPDWSPDGSAITFSSNRAGNDDIWIYYFDDESLFQLTSHSGSDWYPKWSPDGSEIVFCSDRNGSLDIWKIPSTGGTAERITDDPGTEWAPAWSPDGSQVVYVGLASGNNDLWTISSDGIGDPFQVTTYSGHDLLASWSPDGTKLVFGSDRSGNIDLWTIPDNGGTATRLTTDVAYDGNPDWSPNGKFIAFGSNRAGNEDLWILSLSQFTRITEGPLVTNSARSSGVCVIDYDDDGDLDIYETNARTPVMQNNCLYENNGDGTFLQISDLEIVQDDNFSTGAIWADYDNDNDLDLFISAHRTHPNLFYINNGDGSFSLDTSVPMDDEIVGSTTSSWVDYNNDGYLDIYIGNATCGSCEGYPPYRNFLFKNNNGTFSEITSGDIVTSEKHTYGASWCDFDNDGDPDLIAPVNLESGEYTDLYRNEGDDDFTLLSSSVICQTSGIGGGSSWADYDNDGDMDLFISGNSPGPSLLYTNNGDGTFSEAINNELELLLDRPVNGSWVDYDNDGDQDILLWSTIYEFGTADSDSSLGYLFNNNNGVFSKISDTLIFSDSSLIAATAWGDYDRDGDLDLYVPMFKLSQAGVTNYFYENNGNANNWITIKPLGTISNKSSIGAKVRIKANIFGYPSWQMREITSQIEPSTQPPLEAHFGLGDATIIDSIKIEWPGGQITDILTDVPVNQFLIVTESVCGDIDGVPGISILDVVYLINFRYRSGPPPYPYYAADVNSDDDIGILDVVYLINFKYKEGPGPDCP